jgi:hypothetical protein
MMKLGAAIAATAFVAGVHAEDAAEVPAPHVNPFWLNPALQFGMEFRDTDTIISVPGKSGTTWTMNIFHQLRSGGDPDFKDLYAQVPWIEFMVSVCVTLVTVTDMSTRHCCSIPCSILIPKTCCCCKE